MMLSGSPRTSEASDFTPEQGCEVTGVLLQPLPGIAGMRKHLLPGRGPRRSGLISASGWRLPGDEPDIHRIVRQAVLLNVSVAGELQPRLRRLPAPPRPQSHH